MHKKLAADLTSLAHSILQIKNKEDVFLLKEKAYEVYEKLTLLAYVEEYLNTTPNVTETKEDIIEKIKSTAVDIEGKEDDDTIEADKITEVETITEKVEKIVKEMKIENEVDEVINGEKNLEVKEIKEETEDLQEEHVLIEPKVFEEPKTEQTEEIIEQPFDELEQTLFSVNDQEKNDVRDVAGIKQMTLEEELEDTISVEVAADMFEKVEEKRSLNEQLQQNIQIGLNDRIAFVKNLFDGNQEDFNRVVSQLNTTKTFKEAKKFVNKMVKPDYNWLEKEEYEERFMEIIERKFL